MQSVVLEQKIYQVIANVLVLKLTSSITAGEVQYQQPRKAAPSMRLSLTHK